MRNLFVFFVLVFGVTVTTSAKNYYVSASGNDANTGLSTTAPWKTIKKVNSFFTSIVAGDSILFRCGDVFYGALVVGKSGTAAKPIIISSYGTGAKPVVSGLTKLSAWVDMGNGIYQSSAPGAKSTLNMVTIDDLPQAIGRYPNAGDANGGYLNYESYSGTASITDAQLTSTTNWTGAEVVIRKKLWVLDRCKVVSQSGTTIKYTNSNSTYDGTAGFGYFFQNDPRTLDKLGEWYFNNGTKYLQMYFGTASPTTYDIEASTIDTLLTISSKNYINIKNIAFDGANGRAVYLLNSTYINIQNCDIRNSGNAGIMTQNVSYLLVENTTTNHILSSAMQFNNSNATNTTIRNCIVKNTGTLPGMGQNSSNTYKGILAYIKSNLLIEYNTIDTTGYTALEFQGSNITIQNNVINYFCYNKDDGGGIYCWAGGTDAAPGTIYTNRVIKNNIVMNGVGAPYGRNSMNAFVSGIYLDGRPMNIDVINNSVFNVAKNGIASNNPNNINITGNTSYNNLNSMTLTRWAWGTMHNLSIRNNIFYPKTSAQRNLYYTNTAVNEPVPSTFQAYVQALGNIDSNYYSSANQVGFTFEYYLTTGGAGVPDAPRSLAGWKEFSGHDIHSQAPAKQPVLYKITNLVGANKFTNGSFTANILGLTPATSGMSALWDNTTKITGAGSLKISFASPSAGKYGLLHSAIGAISSSKKYVLRFTTLGSTAHGIVRAYIRRTASPYNSLVEIQSHAFGIGKTNHEFLFTAPATVTGGSYVIEILQTSGVTYIDNIEFYEANATELDVNDQLRFEYNATKVAKTVPLDANYTGVDGTVYTGSITLQPYTSKILIKDTGTVGALKAAAAATAVSCYGGTANITVTATGGTAPYTGTGTFAAAAGTYTYTVTDAAGGSSSANVTVTQPAAALVVAVTAGTVSGTGGTAPVTVTATGGTAPYTGTGTFNVVAGTYNYTVTDAKGCSSTKSVTVSGTVTSGSLMAVASSIVDLNCFGNSSNVAVTATGGTAPYTGTGSFPVAAGKGTYKLSFPVSTVGTYTSLYYAVGTISSSKNYILRFTTLGTTANGKLRAAIRLTTTPWTAIIPKQTATFGTVRTDHEFLFIAPPTTAAASFLIQIEQASGTTYIDNIAFYEASADGKLIGNNLYEDGQFEKGITTLFSSSNNNNQTAVWDTTAKITATKYFTVKDANNATSVAIVKTTQPSAPLKITTTSGILTVLGGLVPVTVSATGGTAPYTGTGSFSVGAGTYTYTVTDAKGCTSSAVVTISLVLGRGAQARGGNSPTTTAATATVAAKSGSAVTVTENKSLAVTAYPNPTTSSFNLVLEGGSTEKINIFVYSYDGRIVYQTAGSSNSKYIFGSNLGTGIYTVKIVQGSTVQSMKLVKVY